MRILCLLFCTVYVSIFAVEDGVQRSALLEIDGESHQVVVGETTRIAERDIRVLGLGPMVIHFGSVSLQITGDFAFTEEPDPRNGSSYTFDGESVVLMLYRFTDPVTLELLTENMAETYQEMGFILKKTRAELGAFTGSKIDLSTGAVNLSMEILDLGKRDGVAYFLVLQDSLEDGAQHSNEYAAVHKELLQTLRVEDEP